MQGLLDAAVAVLDDLSGHCADEGVECLSADRVDDAVAHFLRIETRGGEPLGQHCFVIGTDLRVAHVVGAIAGAARDVSGDRTGT